MLSGQTESGLDSNLTRHSSGAASRVHFILREPPYLLIRPPIDLALQVEDQP
jgi:hypothetical protein